MVRAQFPKLSGSISTIGAASSTPVVARAKATGRAATTKTAAAVPLARKDRGARQAVSPATNGFGCGAGTPMRPPSHIIASMITPKKPQPYSR